MSLELVFFHISLFLLLLSYCKNLSISGFTIPICVLLFYQSDKSEFADIVSVYELTIESIKENDCQKDMYECKAFDLFI